MPFSPAYAGKSVTSPYVSAHEVEIEYKGQYDIDEDNDVDGTWEQKVAVGYGVTDNFYVESGVEFEDEPHSDAEAKALEVEAKYQLTEKGQYFVDAGVLAEYKYSLNSGVDVLEAKALLAKEIGNFENYANLIIEKEVGEGSSDRYEHGLALSSIYMYSPDFDFGLEYYASFGDSTEDYDDQKHRVGPVLYGEAGGIGYEVGALFGISEAAPDATLKLNLEYEFHL